MSEFAIQVENLGKQYRLGRTLRQHDTLRDALVHNLLRPLAGLRRGLHSLEVEGPDAIWALRDVSLGVRPGEVMGVIGRNGAGKSTLLKILSRITEPTEGRGVINGRVGSLLEVGTGFHPELTGRENIFLNGAILGMRKQDIRRRFDEIVAFGEIEQFLDTPVKRYSSGMFMRLAFAVASHLEPEILLVDETLAVGDAVFQKKCLGKMGEVAKEGRTVLFVSHNLGAIQSLCTTALLLEEGQVHSHGPAGQVVHQYLSKVIESEHTMNPVLVAPSSRTKGTAAVHIVSLGIHDRSGDWRQKFSIWEPVVLVYEIENREPIPKQISCWFSIVDSQGSVVGTSIQYDSPHEAPSVPPLSRCRLEVIFEDTVLPPGNYLLNAGVLGKHREILDWCEHVISYTVAPVFANGNPYDDRVGSMALRSRWGRFSAL